MSYLFETVWRSGLQGKLLIGLLALLACVAVASLVIALVQHSAAVTGTFMWLVALVALGAVAATRTTVAAGRAVVLGSALPGVVESALDPSEVARRASDAVTVGQASLFLASVAFAVSALVALVPLWRSDFRRASRLAASGACALFAIASAFVVVYLHTDAVPFHYCEGQDKARCLFEHFERLRTITDTGSTVILAFGSAALLVAVFFALRPEPEKAAGMGLFSTGVVMLGLGGIAFAATRGMARDAHEPLSVPVEGTTCLEWWPNPPPVPRARSECEAVSATYFACSASGVSIDGIPVSHAELEKVLRTRRELWIQLNPGQKAPDRVIVLAEDALPRSLFQPGLAVARRVGYTSVGVLAQEPQPGVTTATLGVVPRRGHCCATFFELDPRGRPIESFATWGALHEAAARDATLAVSIR